MKTETLGSSKCMSQDPLNPTADDTNPALPFMDPKTTRIMVYSLLWVMQDLYHQPYGGRIARTQMVTNPRMNPRPRNIARSKNPSSVVTEWVLVIRDLT